MPLAFAQKLSCPDNPTEEDFGIREADLAKHLENKSGEDKAAEPLKTPEKGGKDEKSGKDDKGGKKTESKPLEPGEVVSKNDFQVNQALNLLKGISIIQGR